MNLPRLHIVTDDRTTSLPDLTERVRRLAISEQIALHLRSSLLLGRRLLELAETLKQILDPAGALLIVNDRVDVALASGAAGVHLPEPGLPVEAARRIAGDRLLVGRSVHQPRAARTGRSDGPDYVFLGPIWPTPSHPETRVLGLDAIREAQPARVIAIGGINAERARECRAAGAYGVAAVSALWDAEDPALAVKAMLLSL